MKQKNIKKLKKIIGYFNSNKQIVKSIEELSELQKELCKFLIADSEKPIDTRDNKATSTAKKNITEEMADVMIMLQQLLIIFDNEKEVAEVIESKIERTLKYYCLK